MMPGLEHAFADALTGSAMLQYHRFEKIGEGTYGIVYKAIDKQTGAEAAQ